MKEMVCPNTVIRSKKNRLVNLCSIRRGTIKLPKIIPCKVSTNYTLFFEKYKEMNISYGNNRDYPTK